MARKIRLSLASKCQLLFGAAVVLLLTAALTVVSLRMSDLVDLDQKQIVKDFGRKYRRVRFKQDDSGRIEIRPEVFRFAPPVKHLNDVQQLFIRGDYIWVMTSTIEPGKGVLFDVFNEQGEYVDHFYLPLQQSVIEEALEDLPLTFQKDHIYVVEYDEDDLPSIVKYRIAAQK